MCPWIKRPGFAKKSLLRNSLTVSQRALTASDLVKSFVMIKRPSGRSNANLMLYSLACFSIHSCFLLSVWTKERRSNAALLFRLMRQLWLWPIVSFVRMLSLRSFVAVLCVFAYAVPVFCASCRIVYAARKSCANTAISLSVSFVTCIRCLL